MHLFFLGISSSIRDFVTLFNFSSCLLILNALKQTCKMYFFHLILSSRMESILAALIYFCCMTCILKLFQDLDISVILFALMSAMTKRQF